ncbi:MAG: chitobiase/beta-hexosaminidase C-terminal domain-containing protein, partial [Oscillospiraceae bacterium]
MKRYIILAVLVVLGAAAAIIYSLRPAEQPEIEVAVSDDGLVELKPVTEATTVSTTSVQEMIDAEITESAEPEEQPAEEKRDAVTYSLPAGFYSENISVELSAENGEAIYFSTDGSDPVISDSTLYTAPIDINAGVDVIATTIRAIAVNEEGESSAVFTRSFVTGQDVDERFSEDTLVFVLSTDPYNLYDYEYGIAVPGKVYDDYCKEHAGEEIPYNAPGNYFMTGPEWERPIYVEVFESTGENVISQPAGVKVVGGYSRVPEHKSFKLIARKSYGSKDGKFKYSFFP